MASDPKQWSAHFIYKLWSSSSKNLLSRAYFIHEGADSSTLDDRTLCKEQLEFIPNNEEMKMGSCATSLKLASILYQAHRHQPIWNFRKVRCLKSTLGRLDNIRCTFWELSGHCSLTTSARLRVNMSLICGEMEKAGLLGADMDWSYVHFAVLNCVVRNKKCSLLACDAGSHKCVRNGFNCECKLFRATRQSYLNHFVFISLKIMHSWGPTVLIALY